MRHGFLVAALAGTISTGCKPSADELARQARGRDEIERQKAHQATVDRLAREQKEQQASHVGQANSFACPITAERMIDRMRACGLNMNGISPTTLCKQHGQVTLNFVASRSCEEIEAMLFGKQ